MDPKLTRSHEHLKSETVSYIINSGFSRNSQKHIRRIQKQIEDKFSDIVWALPPDSLHITLMDWLAPFVDYGEHSDIVFHDIVGEYSHNLREILGRFTSLQLHFNTIKVSPTTIFIQATDSSLYNEIRGAFLERTDLLPNTKRPPTIVHTSIVRFTKEYDLTFIEDFVSRLKIDFIEEVKEFRLVRETQLPMLEYEIIDSFCIGR